MYIDIVNLLLENLIALVYPDVYFFMNMDVLQMLLKFADYRQQQVQINPHSAWALADAVHLIHNKNFDKVSVGVAMRNALCFSPLQSNGISLV